MEDLNKNQLVLLALLVSFVTSIATGIVTVSLMEQAPQSVTQTINKVVTQTIEKVVTEKAPAAVIETIPEEDKISSAVEKNSGSLIKVKLTKGGEKVGAGFIITQGGIMVSDVNPSDFAPEASYYAIFPDGAEKEIKFLKMDDSGFSLFSVMETPDKKVQFNPVILGDSNSLKVGQTILFLTYSSELEKGIISGLVRDITTEGAASSTPENAPAAEKKTIKLIKINTPISLANSGSPIIDLGGRVIGIAIYRNGNKAVIPANLIKEGADNASAAR
ncbi:MAG: serine protease [Patescibacteria group bacterium]